MASITTRAGKGDTLSFTEMDDNFTNLNTAKLESENAGSTGQILTKTATGASWQAAASGGGPSFAVIVSVADLSVSSTASNGNVFSPGSLSEEYDANNIVSINGDGEIVLAAAGTYIIEVISVPLYALGYGPGTASTQLTSPTAYFNLYNTTTATQLVSIDLDTAKHPGNGSGITYRSNLGQISLTAKIVTTTTNNAIRLRVTGQAASNGTSTMRFGGNRSITFKITKLA